MPHYLHGHKRGYTARYTPHHYTHILLSYTAIVMATVSAFV